MVWLLSVVLGAVLLLAAGQYRAMSALKGEKEQVEQQLRVVAGLPEALSGAEWQRSMQSLAVRLVQSEVCRAAILFALSDSGNPEVRGSSYKEGEPSWEVPQSTIRGALEAGRPTRVEADGLLIPVMEDEEPVGLLAVRGAEEQGTALQVAVRLAALVLAGIKSHQRQSALSSTDGLTGLANHRHFQQVLGVALGQAYLEGEALSLILLDIDHFKSVNDRYGHLLGDLVLREIAYLMRRELPAGAVAARYGGEEMAVILQGQPALQAVEIAERLRQVIAEHQIFDFTSGAKLAVTVSLGVARYELGQGKSRLVGRADEALYASKREGRNRVTVAAWENDTSHLLPS